MDKVVTTVIALFTMGPFSAQRPKSNQELQRWSFSIRFLTRIIRKMYMLVWKKDFCKIHFISRIGHNFSNHQRTSSILYIVKFFPIDIMLSLMCVLVSHSSLHLKAKGLYICFIMMPPVFAFICWSGVHLYTCLVLHIKPTLLKEHPFAGQVFY